MSSLSLAKSRNDAMLLAIRKRCSPVILYPVQGHDTGEIIEGLASEIIYVHRHHRADLRKWRSTNGVFYQLAMGRRATKKRQSHPSRSHRISVSRFVEWNGAPLKSVKRGFNHAAKLAGRRNTAREERQDVSRAASASSSGRILSWRRKLNRGLPSKYWTRTS